MSKRSCEALMQAQLNRGSHVLLIQKFGVLADRPWSIWAYYFKCPQFTCLASLCIAYIPFSSFYFLSSPQHPTVVDFSSRLLSAAEKETAAVLYFGYTVQMSETVGLPGPKTHSRPAGSSPRAELTMCVGDRGEPRASGPAGHRARSA